VSSVARRRLRNLDTPQLFARSTAPCRNTRADRGDRAGAAGALPRTLVGQVAERQGALSTCGREVCGDRRGVHRRLGKRQVDTQAFARRRRRMIAWLRGSLLRGQHQSFGSREANRSAVDLPRVARKGLVRIDCMSRSSEGGSGLSFLEPRRVTEQLLQSDINLTPDAWPGTRAWPARTIHGWRAAGRCGNGGAGPGQCRSLGAFALSEPYAGPIRRALKTVARGQPSPAGKWAYRARNPDRPRGAGALGRAFNWQYARRGRARQGKGLFL